MKIAIIGTGRVGSTLAFEKLRRRIYFDLSITELPVIAQ